MLLPKFGGADTQRSKETVIMIFQNKSENNEFITPKTNFGNFTEEFDLDVSRAVIVGVILMSIIVIIIGGNVLVLMAVYANSHLRSTTNYFIVNLACADLLLGITVLPFSATNEILGFWPFGQIFCETWAAIDVLWCTGSIITLCVISVDRYIGVTKPLQHSTIMSEKRACYVIVFVWMVSGAISAAPFVGWKEEPSKNPGDCTVNEQLSYVLFSVAVSFYVPMSVIIFVYIRIYKEAVRHSACLATGVKLSKLRESAEGVTLRVHTGRANSQNGTSFTYQSSSSSEHSDSSKRVVAKFTIAGKLAKFKREKKAAQTLGIVVGVFLLCWFPFFFCLPLRLYVHPTVEVLCGREKLGKKEKPGVLCTSCQIPELFFKIIFWLGYCNSMMNPIIYACSSRDFQRAFRRILHCRVHRSPRSFYKAPSRSTSITDLNRSFRSARSTNQLQGMGFTQKSIRLIKTTLHRDSNLEKLKINQLNIPPTEYNVKLSPDMRNYKVCESCDSENLSISDDQIEALREECMSSQM